LPLSAKETLGRRPSHPDRAASHAPEWLFAACPQKEALDMTPQSLLLLPQLP